MNHDEGGQVLILEQGLNTTEISWRETLQSDLIETQYIIEMDDRLGKLKSGLGGSARRIAASPSYVDDDHVASYYLSLGVDDKFVVSRNEYAPITKKLKEPATATPSGPIKGPLGTALYLFFVPSLNLQTSTFYFTKLGRTSTLQTTNDVNILDSTIRITGATTGFSIDIPIRYIKKI
jgi:hypothetical protein